MADEEKTRKEQKSLVSQKSKEEEPTIFGLRTTANREDQVLDFVSSNADKKKHKVYSIIRPHGMRGYIFVEAETRQDAEQAAFNIPYARGILPKEIDYNEIEHMLEMVKVEMNIRKSDIVEIISGPFKREQAKVTRIDKVKEEVVVELLEAAVPIPITVKMDAVKVVRRESDDEEEPEEEAPVHIPSPEKRSAPIEFAADDDGELQMPEIDIDDDGELPMPPRDEKKPSFANKIKNVIEKVEEKTEEVVEEVKEAAEDAVEKVEEALHIKKKDGVKEKKKDVKEKVEDIKEDIEEKKEKVVEKVEEKLEEEKENLKKELKNKVEEVKDKIEEKKEDLKKKEDSE